MHRQTNEQTQTYRKCTKLCRHVPIQDVEETRKRFIRRNEQTFEQTYEQTLEVLCKHYLQHVPNIDSFREERWLHYMSKINENLYNIYIFMLQMIQL